MIAVAVKGSTSRFNTVALSRDRGGVFTSYNVPSLGSITALTFSSSGSLLYANTLPAGSLVNTIFACTTTSWSCWNTGTIDTEQHAIVNFAVPQNSDNRLFAVGVRGLRNYQDPVVYYYDGFAWNDITIEGSQLDSAPLGGAIAYISKGSTVAVATSQGIMIPNGNLEDGSHTDWIVIAGGLPVVSMMDMVYSAEDDRLVIATMGRGIWYVESVSLLVIDNFRPR